MPTFGFSAYLKLISLNPRPQKTYVRGRAIGSASGGYDFHRSLKLLAHDLVYGKQTIEEALNAAESISAAAERRSAKAGIEILDQWMKEIGSISLFDFGPTSFESPSKNFKVQYLPSLGIKLDDKKTAIHIWNTRSPDLDLRMAYGALALIGPRYQIGENEPEDVAVLSLPQRRLLRLSDVDAVAFSEIGRRTIRRIDDTFEEIRREPLAPSVKSPSKRRPPTPPSI